jgi:hypothetical protein
MIENRKKDKVLFGIYITKKTYEKLCKFIQKKHKKNKKYGLITVEVENAIINWINQQNIIKDNSVPPRIQRSYHSVKEILTDNYNCHFYATKKQLINAIKTVKGSDKRTIKKWIELFERHKQIKRDSLNTWIITT